VATQKLIVTSSTEISHQENFSIESTIGQRSVLLPDHTTTFFALTSSLFYYQHFTAPCSIVFGQLEI
jgi:hypothetical protein